MTVSIYLPVAVAMWSADYSILLSSKTGQSNKVDMQLV